MKIYLELQTKKLDMEEPAKRRKLDIEEAAQLKKLEIEATNADTKAKEVALTIVEYVFCIACITCSGPPPSHV